MSPASSDPAARQQVGRLLRVEPRRLERVLELPAEGARRADHEHGDDEPGRRSRPTGGGRRSGPAGTRSMCAPSRRCDDVAAADRRARAPSGGWLDFPRPIGRRGSSYFRPIPPCARVPYAGLVRTRRPVAVGRAASPGAARPGLARLGARRGPGAGRGARRRAARGRGVARRSRSCSRSWRSSTLLWRRTHPLLAVAVAFGSVSRQSAWRRSSRADEPVGLYTTVVRAAAPLRAVPLGIRSRGRDRAGDHPGRRRRRHRRRLTPASATRSAGSCSCCSPRRSARPSATGPCSRLREIDQVKLREREQLARELHDTVAHHVSAIAIRAQAGRAVAAARPDAAVRALEVIEEEASRTLDEMRTHGRRAARRRGARPARRSAGVADIERLARDAAHGPRVDVELSGDLDELSRRSEPRSTGSRRSRSPTRCGTRAMRPASTSASPGEDDCVRLTVRDDGDASHAERSAPGYGLVGMTERADAARRHPRGRAGPREGVDGQRGAARGRAEPDDHPGARRRRPGARPHRADDDPRRPARHRGGRRGRRRARGGGARPRAAARRVPVRHPHAGRRRHRGDPAARRARRRRPARRSS